MEIKTYKIHLNRKLVIEEGDYKFKLTVEFFLIVAFKKGDTKTCESKVSYDDNEDKVGGGDFFY